MDNLDDRLSHGIAPEILVLMASAWMQGRVQGGITINDCATRRALWLLGIASGLHCKEARWLLEVLADVPCFEMDYHAFPWNKETWLEERMKHDDTPMCQYYRGLVLACRSGGDLGDTGHALLLASAEGGYAPALAWFGKTEGSAWLQRVLELLSPEFCCFLGYLPRQRRLMVLKLCLSFYSQGVRALGSLGAMFGSLQLFHKFLGPLAFATLSARWIAFTGKMEPAVNFIKEKLALVDSVEVRLVVGRELDGFFEWRRFVCCAHPWKMELEDCVSLYIATKHAARRAALQALLVLRQLGTPKDVAVLIARRVYSSRATFVSL
jgi:hypothetical protein